MVKGIVYALTACFIWGLIFVVPEFMTGFNSLEVAMGRFTVYTCLSIAIFLKAYAQGQCRYPRPIWLRALFFSLMSTFVYYVCLVLALRYSSPPIAAIVLGLSPITIAFYGNWKQKECSFRSLILPSLLILAGLILTNAPSIMGESASNHLLGLFFASCSLAAWSWYVVDNSKFLKNNPQVASQDWATLMGVSTLFWVTLFGFIFWVASDNLIDTSKYTFDNPYFTYYIGGSIILGVFCSWLGGFLWNKATFHLPVSLAGQLTIFETLFGLCFAYSIAREMPLPLEIAGILLFLCAIVFAIRRSSTALQHPA